jgi:hypothetical protein
VLTVLFEDKVEASKTIDKRVEELRPEISFRSQEAVAHRPRVDETQWPKASALDSCAVRRTTFSGYYPKR